MPLMNAPEVNTLWDTPVLFLRKDFTLETLPSEFGIITHNNAIADIYINGEFAIQIYSIKTQDKELKVTEVPLPPKAVRYEFGNSKPLYHFDLGLVKY